MAVLDVDAINQPGFNQFTTLMGIEFTEWEEGRCAAKVDVRDELFHPGGIVHGGVAFALADSTMAHALISTLQTGQDCSTIELKISYLGSVKEGTMACESEVIKRGRRVAFLESKVFNGDRLVATATGTFAIIQRG